jgi:DNA-binding CsgD family transcriptional regulator
MVASPRRSTAGLLDQHAANPALRNTGIHFATELQWGAHLCVFYDTKEDLLDTLACYFEAGLESNEFCVWAVSDPITEENAKRYLDNAIPRFSTYLSTGQFEILHGHEWYLDGGQFSLKRITSGWSGKLSDALTRGYEGVRISGNSFWLRTNHWKDFYEYEHELNRSLAGQKMLCLCTYSFRESRSVDLLDVARAHQFCVARRNGNWEVLETPELKQAKREIERLNAALDILSMRIPGQESLTQWERVVLAQIVRGSSSKDAARILGISPRTIEFHRANIIRKLGVKRTIDLVRRVLSA